MWVADGRDRRGVCQVWTNGDVLSAGCQPQGHWRERKGAPRDDDTRYGFSMVASVDFTISFESPDEEGWIVARILEIPGAMSQGRSREEARENVLDALRTVLTPDEELAGEAPAADREHLRFTAAA